LEVIAFKPIKDVKVYQQVVEQIKDMIKSGELQPGDRLPSERDLVERLQVSRTSIREALSALQIIGVVESRHGEGNYIRAKLEENFLEPLSVLFLLDRTPAEEILQFRQLLEAEAARLAAERATPPQLAEIGAAVERLERYQQDEEENIRWDKELHYAIAKAAGNRLLYNVINSISDLMDVSIKDSRAKILADPANQDTLVRQHKGIYAAIAAGRGDLAAARMREHLDYVNACIVGKVD
jgi:GntR family transcriptional repressor for pyruvate dehydrogenase complex